MSKTRNHSALDGWIDVFRTGEHTDSSGSKRVWNEAELDSMAAASHETADPVPVVVGHPETDAPAYGWVQSVRRVGDRLQAKLRDVDPGFRTAVESGRYGPRSVALDKDDDGWRLRHLGFLGAAAPAVSGLSPSQFTARFEGPAVHVYELADDAQFASPETERWGFKVLAQIMRRWRERVIEKDGVEAADAVIPEWDLEAVADAGAPGDNARFAAPPAGSTEPEEHEEDAMPKETEQRQAELTAEQQKLETEKAAFAKHEAAFAEKERKREAQSELDSHVAAGRVLPGEREGLAAFMAALPEGETATFTFAAGGDAGGEITKTPRAYFSGLLGGLAKRVDYNERAPGGDSPAVDGQDTGRVVAEAEKLMAATPGLTIDRAVRQVTAT